MKEWTPTYPKFLLHKSPLLQPLFKVTLSSHSWHCKTFPLSKRSLAPHPVTSVNKTYPTETKSFILERNYNPMIFLLDRNSYAPTTLFHIPFLAPLLNAEVCHSAARLTFRGLGSLAWCKSSEIDYYLRDTWTVEKQVFLGLANSQWYCMLVLLRNIKSKLVII